MIYVLKSIDGWYDDSNVLATLNSGEVLSRIKEKLHDGSEDLVHFVLEIWKDNKRIGEEHFINKGAIDDLIENVERFIVNTK